MSPRQVLAEHSSRELSEWMAYDRAVGLGRDDDLRAGIIASALFNAKGGIPTSRGSKQSRAATPGDFFPHLDADEDEPVAASSHDSHDSHDADGEFEPEPAVDDADAATQALKSAWAAWAIPRNAALKKAEQLDAGRPPDSPEEN